MCGKNWKVWTTSGWIHRRCVRWHHRCHRHRMDRCPWGCSWRINCNCSWISIWIVRNSAVRTVTRTRNRLTLRPRGKRFSSTTSNRTNAMISKISKTSTMSKMFNSLTAFFRTSSSSSNRRRNWPSWGIVKDPEGVPLVITLTGNHWRPTAVVLQAIPADPVLSRLIGLSCPPLPSTNAKSAAHLR